MLWVSFQLLTDLEGGVHVELPVHALLRWPEVAGRLRHGDYLGPVDRVGVAIGDNGGRAPTPDIVVLVTCPTKRVIQEHAGALLTATKARFKHVFVQQELREGLLSEAEECPEAREDARHLCLRNMISFQPA